LEDDNDGKYKSTRPRKSAKYSNCTPSSPVASGSVLPCNQVYEERGNAGGDVRSTYRDMQIDDSALAL
jgi:hypothetical protein